MLRRNVIAVAVYVYSVWGQPEGRFEFGGVWQGGGRCRPGGCKDVRRGFNSHYVPKT